MSFTKKASATIYLADDHKIIREGIKRMLATEDSFTIVGESGDGHDAWVNIDEQKPEVVILDIGLPTMSGIEIARKVAKYHPETKIIILSQNENDEIVQQLLECGIHGFVLKDDAESDLSAAIHAALDNKVTFSKRVRVKVKNGRKSSGLDNAVDTSPALTTREREILKLVAEGYTNPQIGDKLFISPKTVKIHRANIGKKLGLKTIPDLVRYAVRNGYIEA